MKRLSFSKILSATAMIGGSILATSALAQSQGGYGPGNGMGPGMMDGGFGGGWMSGGYGGVWLPVLLVLAIAGLVAWIVAQKKK